LGPGCGDKGSHRRAGKRDIHVFGSDDHLIVRLLVRGKVWRRGQIESTPDSRATRKLSTRPENALFTPVAEHDERKSRASGFAPPTAWIPTRRSNGILKGILNYNYEGSPLYAAHYSTHLPSLSAVRQLTIRNVSRDFSGVPSGNHRPRSDSGRHVSGGGGNGQLNFRARIELTQDFQTTTHKFGPFVHAA